MKLREAIKHVMTGKKLASGSSSNLRAKAIIPVDLFGLCADHDSIKDIAAEFDLFLLEDAAQSFGAERNGKKACGFGGMAATSFFPAKPLGCYGDGGAVFCNDDESIEILRSLRIHGQGTDKYENVRIGINGRMDTIQAAILLAKMEIFDEEIELRQAVARRYTEALKNKFITPTIPQGNRSAWAQYSIQCENRDQKMAVLKNAGIPAAIYYPKPLHLQKAFAYLGYEKGHCSVAEEVSEKILSLPMHPYLEEKDQNRIISTLLA